MDDAPYPIRVRRPRHEDNALREAGARQEPPQLYVDDDGALPDELAALAAGLLPARTVVLWRDGGADDVGAVAAPLARERGTRRRGEGIGRERQRARANASAGPRLASRCRLHERRRDEGERRDADVHDCPCE